MSMLKKIAIFLLSTIFIFSAITAINIYSFKGTLEKENLKVFIRDELVLRGLDTLCSGTCEEQFKQFPQLNISNEECIQICKEQYENRTEELDQLVDQQVNELYNVEVYGISLNKISSFFSSLFLPSIILSIISLIVIWFVAEVPFKIIGNNFIAVGITLIPIGIIMKILELTTTGIMKSVLTILSSFFYTQYAFGVIFIIAGIVLRIFGKGFKFSKKSK